jgi:hypothetical protein
VDAQSPVTQDTVSELNSSDVTEDTSCEGTTAEGGASASTLDLVANIEPHTEDTVDTNQNDVAREVAEVGIEISAADMVEDTTTSEVSTT